MEQIKNQIVNHMVNKGWKLVDMATNQDTGYASLNMQFKAGNKTYDNVLVAIDEWVDGYDISVFYDIEYNSFMNDENVFFEKDKEYDMAKAFKLIDKWTDNKFRAKLEELSSED